MPAITMRQAGQAARRAGWPTVTDKLDGAEQLATLLAIAKAESSLNTTAVNRNRNGTIDVGLWQINSVHGYSPDELRDPTANARAALDVFRRQGWGAWVAYKDGKHRPHMPEARTVAAELLNVEMVAPVGPGGSGNGNPPLITNVVGGLDGLIDLAAKALSALTNPDWWRRVGVGALGVLVLLVGLVFLGRDLITDTAGKLAGAALSKD